MFSNFELISRDPKKSAFGRGRTEGTGTWVMVVVGVMLVAACIVGVVSTNKKATNNVNVGAATTKRFVAGSMVENMGQEASSSSGKSARLSVRETVIGPDPVAAAQQRAIETQTKKLVAVHEQAAMAFKNLWNQYRTQAIAKKDITQAEWTAMVYTQVNYHIEATARDVQLFIEEAAHGLAIIYEFKNYVMGDVEKALPHLSEESKRVVKERVRDAKDALDAMTLKPDIVNKPLAAVYKNTAAVKLTEYNTFKASANQKKQAWLADLARIQAKKSATLAEALASTTLFAVYKVDKTVELVKDYEYMINEGLYIRWEFGNNVVVMDETVRRVVEQAHAKLDEIEKMTISSLF